jgi:hypothetical protein
LDNEPTDTGYQPTIGQRGFSAILCDNIRHHPVLGPDGMVCATVNQSNGPLMINATLQWLGTACLIAMYVVMSYFPEHYPLNIVLGLAGGICYFTWSLRVANKPQQLVNAAGILVCIGGLIRYFG